MFIPWCTNCGSEELLQAVGIIGAVISPHNLYLHSALVKVNHKFRKEITNQMFFFHFRRYFLSFVVS